MKWGVVILFGVVFLVVACSGGAKYNDDQLTTFAQCVTESGATMYGAYWCPHCASQKKMFGEGVAYIDYVECDPRGANEQSELCLEKDIKSYPTWIFGDGGQMSGEVSIERLSLNTDCKI